MSDLQGTIIKSDWDNLALEEGALLDQYKSYSAKIYGRDIDQFETIETKVASINYTPEVNSAKPITIQVEPDSKLEGTSYIDGIVDVFVDDDPLFSGRIVKIDMNQNDDFYSVKAHPPGRRLKDETINKNVSGEIVTDFIAKTIDKYNDWHSEYDDKKNTNEEELVDIEKTGGNRVAKNDGATATYKSIGFDASDVDSFYVKVKTIGTITVTFTTTNNSTYSEDLTGLSDGTYGDWYRVQPSGLNAEYYDVEFSMDEDSVLYDWISVVDNTVLRDVEPVQTEVLDEGKKLQDAPSTDSFSSITSVSDTQPFSVGSNEIALQQSLYIEEAESGTSSTLSSIAASGGSHAWFISSGNSFSFSKTTDYKIPEAEVGVGYRRKFKFIKDWSASTIAWEFGGYNVTLDGNTVDSSSGFNTQYFPQDGDLEKQTKAYAHDSSAGTTTDETTESNDDTADDMTLLPSSPSVGDEYYWSHDGEFDEIDIDLSTDGEGTWNVVWEYYAKEYDSNDSLVTEEWRQIPSVSDGTNSFRRSGDISWSIDDIANDTQSGGTYVEWGETSPPSSSDIDQYIRARLDSFSSITTQPLGQKSRCRGGPFDWETVDNWNNGDLSAGSHTLQISCTDDNALMGFDVACFYDQRFSYNFDNQVASENGYLDGPEEYPNATSDSQLVFSQTASNENILTGYIDVTTDASSVASLAIRFDGSQWYSTSDTTSISQDNPGTGSVLTGRLGLERYSPSGAQSATPRFGYDGQNIKSWVLSVDTEDLAVFTSQTFNDNRLSVISDAADSNNVFFRWEGASCKIFERGDLETFPNLKKEKVSSSISIEDVYSSCEVIGKNGTSSGKVTSDNAPSYINRHAEIRNPDITTVDDARREARAFLAEHSTINFTGKIDTFPTRAPLGEVIDGTLFRHGKDTFIKSVRYSKRNATIDCGREKRLFDELIKLDRGVESTKKVDTSS